MNNNTIQIIKKTLISFFISIFVYELYALISFSFVSLPLFETLMEVAGEFINGLEGIMSFYIIGMLVLTLHQKTEGNFIGYLESIFLLWVVLLWVNDKDYSMIKFWFVLIIAGIIYKKVKKISSIFYSIAFFVLCYSWYLDFVMIFSLISEFPLALIVTFILFTVCFSVIECKTRRRYQKDFIVIYGIWGCIQIVGSLICVWRELINDFAIHGIKAFLNIIENDYCIQIYFVFGVAFLVGTLIAWGIDKVDESDRKIAERKNAQNKEE